MILKHASIFFLFASCLLAHAEEPTASAERVGAVRLGIDVLVENDFDVLQGKRVGLITNHTGVDSHGRATADLLAETDSVTLVRLFGPEHGIRGALDQSMIEDGVDAKTGVPIVSLYGPRRKPDKEHLAGLDVLVFDIQDIGCRFYTYIATMKLVMEAAAEAGIPVVVLDRPNPLGGTVIEGPMNDPQERSFVACHHLPIRHGMTVGELAQLFAAEGAGGKPLSIDLQVIACRGWKRSKQADATGQLWINPSPNMRRLSQALLYPGVGLLETTNLSVGRGTDTPFEILGAPWIDPWEFAEALNQGRTKLTHPETVSFVPRYFTPSASKFADQRCGGVDIVLRNTDDLDSVEVGFLLISTLRKLYPEHWEFDRYNRLLANSAVYQQVITGAKLVELRAIVKQDAEAFTPRRAPYLIYP